MCETKHMCINCMRLGLVEDTEHERMLYFCLASAEFGVFINVEPYTEVVCARFKEIKDSIIALQMWSEAFNQARNKRFEEKEKDYGNTWKTLPIEELERLLRCQCAIVSDMLNWLNWSPERIEQLQERNLVGEYIDEVLKELVDLANRCQIVWQRMIMKRERQMQEEGEERC